MKITNNIIQNLNVVPGSSVPELPIVTPEEVPSLFADSRMRYD